MRHLIKKYYAGMKDEATRADQSSEPLCSAQFRGQLAEEEGFREMLPGRPGKC